MANNIEIFRGDDRTILINFTLKGTSTPFDITGFKLYFTVKNSSKDADTSAIITKTQTSHINAAQGQSSFALSNTDTEIDPKNYYYDIQAKDASDKIITILKGNFNILADITRSKA